MGIFKGFILCFVKWFLKSYLLKRSFEIIALGLYRNNLIGIGDLFIIWYIVK